MVQYFITILLDGGPAIQLFNKPSTGAKIVVRFLNARAVLGASTNIPCICSPVRDVASIWVTKDKFQLQ
jgi:hypothetical protein